MEILKGMVREKGFEDKECTYMKTDDGKQFYFIENFQLSNGNIMACSDLSQGVGNKPRETLGVITPRGDIVIPFENKMIKPLDNNLLLVERNTPTTPNVVDALAKKDDPQATTSFMNDANTIKSQLKSVMAGGENFVFDNPFSEAALYTLEGVNVGGSYFSFIGQSGNDFYLSTNIVGSSILKYDSSVNVNGAGADANNEMTPSSQESVDNTTMTNENAPSDGNTNVESQGEVPQDVSAPVENQVGNEGGENSLSQEPLVPNIEIPLQLQQQVEDSMPSADGVVPPSVDGAETNQEVPAPPAENPAPPTEPVVNTEQATTETTNEVPPAEEPPKPELNIDLPLSGALEENNQEAATNTEGESNSDASTNTDNSVDVNADSTPTDEASADNSMVSIDGDTSPSESLSEDSSSVDVDADANADTENDNSSTPEEEISIPLPEQSEESEEEESSEEDNSPSEENPSSEDLNIPEVAEEESEESAENDTVQEDDTTQEEVEIPSEDAETEEDEEPDEEDSDEGGTDIEPELPENVEEDEEEEEISNENNIEEEPEEVAGEIEDDEEYQEEGITNPVIIDATNTIRKLLEENRKQREIIDRQDSEIETLTSSNSILKENNDSKSKEIISLRSNMAKYRSQNSALSRENNTLKATNTRQEEVIENLKSQNITLKEQVAGISALGNAVKEATTVIETHQEDFSEPTELSYLDTEMGEIAYQKKKTI